MPADPLIERDHLVNDLRGAVHEGESGLNYVPRLVLKVIETEAWRERYDTKARQEVSFESFGAFVVADPTAGLGASADLIQRIVKGTDAERSVARLLKAEIAPAKPVGRPKADTEKHRTTNISGSETAGYTVARLKRDDPALAEKVVSGELSAYAAARSKGWKPPRIQVTTPERTAAHLRKHMAADQLAELARLLVED